MATKAMPGLTGRRPMDEVAAGFQTKSDKIRALARAGYSRAEIARHLDIRYQHVRNVLVEDERLASRVQSPLQPDAPANEMRGSSPRRRDPAKSRVDADGRVAIPAIFREALGLKENEPVILTIEDESIRLMSLAASVRQAQAMVRKIIPPGVSLVDELLAERRLEAQRERDDNG